MTKEEELVAIKKERDAKLAEVQRLQVTLNGINTQMQDLDKTRQGVTEAMNRAATRAVELQGVIKFLESEAPPETKPETPPATPAPETPATPAPTQ